MFVIIWKMRVHLPMYIMQYVWVTVLLKLFKISDHAYKADKKIH